MLAACEGGGLPRVAPQEVDGTAYRGRSRGGAVSWGQQALLGKESGREEAVAGRRETGVDPCALLNCVTEMREKGCN